MRVSMAVARRYLCTVQGIQYSAIVFGAGLCTIGRNLSQGPVSVISCSCKEEISP